MAPAPTKPIAPAAGREACYLIPHNRNEAQRNGARVPKRFDTIDAWRGHSGAHERQARRSRGVQRKPRLRKEFLPNSYRKRLDSLTESSSIRQ